MTPDPRLTADLRELVEEWQALAMEARQRADQRRRGDLDPAYLYGLSEGLERSAAAIREPIAGYGKRTG
jgi:hypothetical protein